MQPAEMCCTANRRTVRRRESLYIFLSGGGTEAGGERKQSCSEGAGRDTARQRENEKNFELTFQEEGIRIALDGRSIPGQGMRLELLQYRFETRRDKGVCRLDSAGSLLCSEQAGN